MKKIACMVYALVLCFLCVCCATNGGTLTIDASRLSDKPVAAEQTFRVGKYTFAYYNVYKNQNNEFVFTTDGYLKTINGSPDHLVKFDKNANVHVYDCTKETGTLSPSIEIEPMHTEDRIAYYCISECTDIAIYFLTNPGEQDPPKTATIPNFVFYC